MKKKSRFATLTATFLAALLSGGAALAGQGNPVQQPEPVQAEILSAGEDYLLREVDGMVTVFRQGEFMQKTQIPADMLRESDRQALRQGIPADSMEDLLRLIEDFDS